jgi:hypothetical protein
VGRAPAALIPAIQPLRENARKQPLVHLDQPWRIYPGQVPQWQLSGVPRRLHFVSRGVGKLPLLAQAALLAEDVQKCIVECRRLSGPTA